MAMKCAVARQLRQHSDRGFAATGASAENSISAGATAHPSLAGGENLRSVSGMFMKNSQWPLRIRVWAAAPPC